MNPTITPVTILNNNQLTSQANDEALPNSDESIEEPETPNPVLETRTRSVRVIQPTNRFIESQQQKEAGIVSYHILIEDPGQYSEIDRFQELAHPLSYTFKATSDPDTLYLHRTLNAADSNKFKEAMV